eukprot:11338144-Ditylum_brightwellii.AAC.1
MNNPTCINVKRQHTSWQWSSATNVKQKKQRQQRHPSLFSTLTAMHHLLIVLILCYCTTGISTNEGYTSTAPTTVLSNYIHQRKYDNALERLNSHPEEAFILVTQHDSHNHMKQLPLHLIFSINVPPNPAAHGGTEDHDDVATHGMSPLQVQLAQNLLKINPKGAQVVDQKGRTPLHLAAYSPISPPRQFLTLLIESYPDALHLEDDEGRVPLHCATHQPATSTEVIQILMESYPEALRMRDKGDGDALPIHLLAWGGHALRSGMKQSFQVLYEAYPESIHEVDGDGDTPLMGMVKYGRASLDMIQYALK